MVIPVMEQIAQLTVQIWRMINLQLISCLSPSPSLRSYSKCHCLYKVRADSNICLFGAKYYDLFWSL